MKAFPILPSERVVRQIDVEKGQSITSLISPAVGAESMHLTPALDIWTDINADNTRGLPVFSMGQPEHLFAGNALIIGPHYTSAQVEIATILAMVRWTELQTSGEVGIGRQIADVYHNGLPILEVRDGDRFLIWSVVHGQWMGASGTPADAERYSRQRAIDIFHRNPAMLPIREIDAIAAGLVK